MAGERTEQGSRVRPERVHVARCFQHRGCTAGKVCNVGNVALPSKSSALKRADSEHYLAVRREVPIPLRTAPGLKHVTPRPILSRVLTQSVEDEGRIAIASETEYSLARRSAAWAVHLMTATGAVVGLMAIIAIARHQWLLAFTWMAVTIGIDSVDGMCARACRVKEVLPHFDGALLDNIVDYFTYVIVPASFLYETHSVPTGFNLVSATLISLASAYQFCQIDAKTNDHCFKGFPSYWNVVAFYLFMLDWPEWVNLAIIVLLTAGVFIPIKYLYPSRTRFLRPLNLALTVLWGCLLTWAMLRYPNGHRPLLYLSLAYVGYYFAMSALLTAKGDPAAREEALRER